MINAQNKCIAVDISLSTVEVFEQFALHKYAILLDSSDAIHENSHYDIISFKPAHILEAKSGQAYLDGLRQEHSVFAILKQKLSELCPERVADLPFVGGWLGYFGYDLGRYIEKLPESATRDISLPDMTVGLYLDALIFDNKKKKWYYVSQSGINRLDEYLATLQCAPSNPKPFKLLDDWQSNMTMQQYQTKFDKIHQYLLSGDCYQINLAQRFSARFDGSPWQAYKKLRAHNKSPFAAFYNLGEDTAIVSVSPERFISVKASHVETKPIKGTLPRLSDPKADLAQAKTLQNSSKDRAENVMIVDLLRNDLGKVAKAGTVNVPKLFEIESFPAVHHLVSTVTSELANGKNAVDQLEAAFPGGSITGAPKIRAMEIIEELEPHRRSAYCGSMGYLSACGDMDTSITIRTLVCAEKTIYCWAGGGIVADSQVDAEYQETYHKVNKILPVLK
ncbi:aminodeoxychorismate synthase component I [Pseudoalteromonas luteoviolacea]|uniref:aminodeoxychorismate synthase component I n=1 Tax=Pseudoalteromonas luteoviolacea TaxID=43657 RepID=UPI001B37ED64|nr:aminodeoxychorismate synthase component I [Pseudoalteromonas luteoviolacea]MBQ4814115.1 aminodeoxychorismate synthase component I [Pseudoalteromonas luteoviolacea]